MRFNTDLARSRLEGAGPKRGEEKAKKTRRKGYEEKRRKRLRNLLGSNTVTDAYSGP